MGIQTRYLAALTIGLISGLVIAMLLFSSGSSIFGDKCVRCKAIAGDGGDGAKGGKAIAAPVGPGGSCVAEIIGDACGGSTGSSEPRGGQGGNGGDGGDAIIFGKKTLVERNQTDLNSANINSSGTDEK
jgi:hypothetical protein